MKDTSRTLLIVLPNKSHEFLIKSGLKVEQSEAMSVQFLIAAEVVRDSQLCYLDAQT